MHARARQADWSWIRLRVACYGSGTCEVKTSIIACAVCAPCSSPDSCALARASPACGETPYRTRANHVRSTGEKVEKGVRAVRVCAMTIRCHARSAPTGLPHQASAKLDRDHTALAVLQDSCMYTQQTGARCPLVRLRPPWRPQ
jgi:hypothetical protein